MIGIDLFDLKRKNEFSDEIIKRFFLVDEQKQIFNWFDKQALAAKFWCVKEAVYKILHNLYPQLYFNKLRIKVDYTNYVFKVQYVKEEKEIGINEVVDSINWNKIYISDSDENNFSIFIAMYQNN